MKISYIILPFESAEYLIRCVNSLYRQLGDDYEVILGENFFGEEFEELREFFGEKKELIRISQYPETNEEKLKEAFSLVSDDSDYVMLIDVDTVVSPIAAQAMLSCDGAELIIPAAAVKKENGFVIDAPDKDFVKRNPDKYPFQRFCYGKKLLEKINPQCICDMEKFYIFIISLFAEKAVVESVNEICFYSEPFKLPETTEHGFENVKSAAAIIFDKLHKIDDAEVCSVILDKLIFQTTYFLGAEEETARLEAFSLLRDIGIKVQDKLLFRKLFEVKIGFDLADFLSLDYNEYKVYKSLAVNAGSSEAGIASADLAKQEKMIMDLNNTVKETQKDIAAIGKKIAEFAKSQNQAVAAVIGARQNYSDPALDIPKMYREGRLGLKTIIRSFSSWLKYKFSRKK